MSSGGPTFPQYLAERAKIVRAGDIPLLLAHPDWKTPAPAAIWLHGRTASKEMDPGRYMRWLRAGIAVVAVDLPGHGARAEPVLQESRATLEVIERALGEIDPVIASLDRGLFDTQRLGIGGMSLGGMITLRTLCEPRVQPFKAAAVEGTCGWLSGMYFPVEHGLGVAPWPIDHPRARVELLDPAQHLATFAPLPLLAMHSETDEMVPWEVQRRFLEKLRAHYAARGANPSFIEVKTWPRTGAPREHIGFGTFSNDAKNIQTEFFARTLSLV